MLDGGLMVLDLDAPQARTRIDGVPDYIGAMSNAVDASGTRIAGPWGNRNPNVVRVGRLSRGRIVDRTAVPDSPRTFRVLAWLDDDHVAVVHRIGAGWERTALSRLDVRTGETSVTMRLPEGTSGYNLHFPTGLLSTPSVDRPAPPRPLDPRVVTGLSVGVVLAGLGAIVAWRRRVRP